MAKRFCSIIAIAIVIIITLVSIVFLICGFKDQETIKLGHKTADDIDITMSTVIKRVDLNNDPYINYCLEYPDNYEEESGYYVYNYFLKVDNNSKYDIYNVFMKTFSSNSDKYKIDQYLLNSVDPFNIKAGESEIIPLVISIKNDLTDDEINKIMNSLSKDIFIRMYDPEKDPFDYSKTIKDSYHITNEDYSDKCVSYPTPLP